MTLPLPRQGDALAPRTKPQRTYSRRVQKDLIEHSTPPKVLQTKNICQSNSLPPKIDAPQASNPKKRSISDFFRPIVDAPRPSSPALSLRQSSPIPSSPQTVPSSPPPLYSADEKENQPLPKKRTPRQLTSTPRLFHKYTNGIMENIVLENTGADVKKGAIADVKEPVTSSRILKIPAINMACAVTDEVAYRQDLAGSLTTDTSAGSTIKRAAVIPSSAPININYGALLGKAADITIILDTAHSPVGSAASDSSDSPRSATFGPQLGATAEDGEFGSIRSNVLSTDQGVFDFSDGEQSPARPAPSGRRNTIHGDRPSKERMDHIRNGFGVDREAGNYKGSSSRNRPFGLDGAGSGPDVGPGKHRRLVKIKRKARMPTKRVKHVQTTLNRAAHGMVAREPKKCECGFLQTDYTGEENATHAKDHKKFLDPLRINNSISSGGRPVKREYVKLGKAKPMLSSSIITVTNVDATAWKNFAEEVVKKLERDVPGLELTKTELWSSITYARFVGNSGGDAAMMPRFKVFLGVVNNDVVSVVVAELIFKAYLIEMIPCDGGQNSDYEDGCGEGVTEHKQNETGKVVDATMGIHYVWTHEKHRKLGIAAALLDYARHGGFIAGLHIQRNDVAWTNLTKAGEALACYIHYGFNKTGYEWEFNCYQPL